MSQKAGVFIIHNKKLLIGHPTRHDPLFYSIPKGKIDEAENPAHAMTRELKEETDYDFNDFDGDIPRYLGKFRYKNKRHSIHFFYIILNSKPIKEAVCKSFVNEDPSFPEVDWYKWVSFSEALQHLHEAQRKALRILINKLNVYD